MSGCNNVNVEPTVIGGGDGSTAYDAFGRLRVSEPFTLFDSQNRYAEDDQFSSSHQDQDLLLHLQQMNLQ